MHRMQIVKTVEVYDDQSLAICWEPHEDNFYFNLLPEASEFILNIEDENEEILSTRAVIRSRALVSRALRQKTKAGSRVIVSNCPRGGSQPDGLVYLWKDQEISVPSAPAHFQDLLLSTRFESFTDEQLRILFFLLNENKELLRKTGEIQLELERIKVPKPDSHEILKENFSSQSLFPDRKVFRSWVLEKFAEVEPNTRFLERNYPKEGLFVNRKVHIDFLFQDSNNHYLLVEICYYNKGWQEDLMTYIYRLNQARELLAKSTASNPMNIRRMIITNSLLHGMKDACTINQVELIHIGGFYRMEKFSNE